VGGKCFTVEVPAKAAEIRVSIDGLVTQLKQQQLL